MQQTKQVSKLAGVLVNTSGYLKYARTNSIFSRRKLQRDSYATVTKHGETIHTGLLLIRGNAEPRRCAKGKQIRV
ncbi:hypothetical protein GCM10008090_10810 [Arenicella chitinivorans]|uniref:Uncharacterized protein n=1 Tax=Arenicella chitinivorans TaxID=1329800 RepID=A0A918RM20_9GAMM|nr:hypothetical protein GCM10008090_10810 [Arenicella chitinivorans]